MALDAHDVDGVISDGVMVAAAYVDSRRASFLSAMVRRWRRGGRRFPAGRRRGSP